MKTIIIKDVVGYESSYSISEYGEVFSKERTFIRFGSPVKVPYRKRKPRIDKLGRMYVDLWRGNKRRAFSVHSLVACSFLGKKPEGMEICHNDGDAANNHFSNLRYDTHAANMNDMALHGRSQRGENQWNAKLTEKDVVNILKTADFSKSSRDAFSKKYGVHRFTIDKIIRGDRWKHIKI